MSIEGIYSQKIDYKDKKEKEEGRPQLENLERLVGNISESGRIDESSFQDVYSKEEIEGDIEKVEKSEKAWNKSMKQDEEFSKRYANASEFLIAETSEKNKWLGSDLKVSRASKYDDFFNGVDLIFEIGDSDNVLAVDLTYSNKKEDVVSKIRDIKEDFDKKSLSEIKYFQSKLDEAKKGKLENIPKVVVALNFDDLAELSNLYALVEEDTPEGIPEKLLNQNRKKLENSIMQIEILQQVIDQIEHFMEYSKQEGNEDLVNILEKRHEKLVDIMKSEEIKELHKYLVNKKDFNKSKVESGRVGRVPEIDDYTYELLS